MTKTSLKQIDRKSGGRVENIVRLMNKSEEYWAQERVMVIEMERKKERWRERREMRGWETEGIREGREVERQKQTSGGERARDRRGWESDESPVRAEGEERHERLKGREWRRECSTRDWREEERRSWGLSSAKLALSPSTLMWEPSEERRGWELVNYNFGT